jgi:hypothetical protein
MRRKLITVSALPACFILGICAQIVSLSSDPYEPKSSVGTLSQGYDLTGYYYPAREFPLIFNNVRRIDLTTADFHVNSDSSVTRTAIAPKGYLITDYDVFKLSDVSIDGDRVSFTTEQRIGETYQFTGTVSEGDYPIQGFAEYYVGRTIMVHGRLGKLLFGFKVAEREVRFTKGSAC